jgi:hypothetical protein
VNEIKRNTWARFCRKFNRANQYRLISVEFTDKRGRRTELGRDARLLGITLTKEGRFINGVDLYTDRYDPDCLGKPFLTVLQPTRMLLEKDSDGTDCGLLLETPDGATIRIHLCGDRDTQAPDSLVEKVAYSIAERRGFVGGSAVDDWLIAEERVREIQSQLVR